MSGEIRSALSTNADPKSTVEMAAATGTSELKFPNDWFASPIQASVQDRVTSKVARH